MYTYIQLPNPITKSMKHIILSSIVIIQTIKRRTLEITQSLLGMIL